MDESLLIKEETNTSDSETNPNNIKQEVPFEFVGIKSEVQVIFKNVYMQLLCSVFMYMRPELYEYFDV